MHKRYIFDCLYRPGNWRPWETALRYKTSEKKSISLRSVGSQKIGAPKINIVPNYAVKWLPLVYSTCKTLFWKIPFVYFPTGKITCCFDDL